MATTKRKMKRPEAPLSTVGIPQWWIVEVDDYHEFAGYKDAYRSAKLKVKYEEVDGRGYYAVFWIGERPEEAIKWANQYYGWDDEDDY